MLSPDDFDKTTIAGAEALRDIAERYRYVIMRGQSSGSFPALAITKSGKVPITHLLIEDGINTSLSVRGQRSGFLSARLVWVRYGLQERLFMPKPPYDNWQLPEKVAAPIMSKVQGLVEQFHWAPLWRSSYSVRSILEIAREQPELPILLKFIGHTATGNLPQIDSLRRDLNAINAVRQASETPAARIQCDYDQDAWHGFLVYPEYGICNLEQIRAMPTLIGKALS